MEKSMSLKRAREENEGYNSNIEDSLKRQQKSLKDIITLFDQDEDDPTQDLSSFISTLQNEISSSDPTRSQPDPDKPTESSEEEVDRVMRHLLEASDDELGIPSTDVVSDSTVEGHVDGGDFLFAFGGDAIWEFEDHEAANYYNLLHPQLFM